MPGRIHLKKRAKYGNVRTARGYHSIKEEKRIDQLRLLEMAGAITNLETQVAFELTVNGLLVCKYIADATYTERGEFIVEDVKSPATRRNAAYRIKVKLMKAVLGLTIKET